MRNYGGNLFALLMVMSVSTPIALFFSFNNTSIVHFKYNNAKENFADTVFQIDRCAIDNNKIFLSGYIYTKGNENRIINVKVNGEEGYISLPMAYINDSKLPKASRFVSESFFDTNKLFSSDFFITVGSSGGHARTIKYECQ
ncbi:TPA: hypothetical protein HNV55_07540 [Escherichia coli]|uniref:hypothetical protein n=1 Tax=Escherichia coli TaxID=562 RepID=UPI000DA4E8E9|nr:hypothetical protein [Escherichia coli]EIA4234836.1 hypothetical protein [Escherichia coli]SQL30108.1 Uncharacterised protein [Escherichia coli]SQL76124.1 Uncharacterised protein [Escherichia coli]HAJ7427490.1 hypothetical protein [Escherichia coli]